MAVEVDIPCDPTQIDQTGLPWAFLDESARPEWIAEGAIVVTGDAEDPVFARVKGLTERASGTKVHLEIPSRGSARLRRSTTPITPAGHVNGDPPS